MKLAIIGSGQLGTELMHLSPDGFELKNFSYPEVDITKPETLVAIKEFQPEAIINCAAYTNVEKAEEEPELARAVNVDGVKNLANIAKNLGCLLVHISTDFVFDGQAKLPYKETDPTNPINAYGATKLAGEEEIRQVLPDNHLIIRTAWLYGAEGPNFVLKMLDLASRNPTLKAVSDETGCPTSAHDLAEAIIALIQNNQRGIFHAVNSGEATRHEWVQEMIKAAGLSNQVDPVPASAFPTKATRPGYSVLSIEKITPFYAFRPWQEALHEYISRLT